MSNSSCLSRSCGCAQNQCGTWQSDCWQWDHCGCNSCGCGNWDCGCDTCGCNQCGSWGCDSCGCNQCGNWGCDSCGCNQRSNSCGCDSCGCNQCGNWGCDSCGCNQCGNWNCGCNSCGNWPFLPPPPPGSMLVPRVIASGRAFRRNVEVTLCPDDLPNDVEAPFTLLSVMPCGPGEWEFITGSRGCTIVRVTLRLRLQIRDANCCMFTAHSSITVDVPLRSSFPRRDHWRTHVNVLPNVRLTCAPVCSNDDGCFDVRLDVAVDVFLTRWEPSSDGITVPCRPDLPLNLPRNFRSCCR